MYGLMIRMVMRLTWTNYEKQGINPSRREDNGC